MISRLPPTLSFSVFLCSGYWLSQWPNRGDGQVHMGWSDGVSESSSHPIQLVHWTGSCPRKWFLSLMLRKMFRLHLGITWISWNFINKLFACRGCDQSLGSKVIHHTCLVCISQVYSFSGATDRQCESLVIADKNVFFPPFLNLVASCHMENLKPENIYKVLIFRWCLSIWFKNLILVSDDQHIQSKRIVGKGM